jgi:ketosteroid isomerase-like protein
MAEHANATTFREGYAAFQAGDLEKVRSLFTEDITWQIPGHNHFSGAHSGIDKVLDLFMRNFAETNGTFKVELHDVLANDEHGVALATVSGQREGKSLSDRYTHVVHFRDGKVSESWIFDENQDEVDAFWT